MESREATKWPKNTSTIIVQVETAACQGINIICTPCFDCFLLFTRWHLIMQNLLLKLSPQIGTPHSQTQLRGHCNPLLRFRGNQRPSSSRPPVVNNYHKSSGYDQTDRFDSYTRPGTAGSRGSLTPSYAPSIGPVGVRREQRVYTPRVQQVAAGGRGRFAMQSPNVYTPRTQAW